MMIQYEEVSFDLGDGEENHIRITRSDGTFEGFRVSNDNPNYIAFLAALHKENPKDPHFVAWVEAGNDPEDFWAQTPDL